MAPSPQRRPGFSRRAQYTTFFGYMAGVLGALLGGALLYLWMLRAYPMRRGAPA